MTTYIRLTTLIATFVLILAPLAVTANSYKVTPRIIDREVKQRDIFTEEITVTNNLHYKLRIYPSVNQVSVDAGGDITAFTAPSVSDNKITPTSWVSISRGAQEVSPGETVSIPVHIKIHPEAEPGVYHMLLGFGSGSNRNEAEEKVKNDQAPSVMVTLSVEQEREEFLKLGRFFIDRFVTKPDNKAVHYTLSNPGDAAVVPRGEIIIYNGRGIEVAAIPVNSEEVILAPGQETEYSIDAPTEGLLGKYKAFLTIDYGSEQVASVYDTVFFYVMPWQKLLIIFGVVLLVAIVLTVVLHRKLGGDAYDDDDADHVPFYVRETVSEDKDHDINLKQQ